jgi:hypothetical protein
MNWNRVKPKNTRKTEGLRKVVRKEIRKEIRNHIKLREYLT